MRDSWNHLEPINILIFSNQSKVNVVEQHSSINCNQFNDHLEPINPTLTYGKVGSTEIDRTHSQQII